MIKAISELANDLNFSFYPKYECIEAFRDVPFKAIVRVEIENDTVYIYYNKRISCTNVFILDMHFEEVLKWI